MGRRRMNGEEKRIIPKEPMSYMLTGSNSKKLLSQTNVNKEHVFLKNKIISQCSITAKGQIFLDTQM